MEVAEFKVLRDIRNELQITNKNLDEIKTILRAIGKEMSKWKNHSKVIFLTTQ